MDLSIVPQVIKDSAEGAVRGAIGLGSMGIVPISSTSKAANLVMDRGGPGAAIREEWRKEDTVNKALDAADFVLTVVPGGLASKGLAKAGTKAAKGATDIAKGARNVIQTKKYIATTKPMEEALLAQQRIPHIIARANATKEMQLARLSRSPRNLRRKRRLKSRNDLAAKADDLARDFVLKGSYRANKRKKAIAEARLKGIDEAEAIVDMINQRMIKSARQFNTKAKRGLDTMKSAGVDVGKILSKTTTQLGPAYTATHEARKRWNKSRQKNRRN